MDLDFEIYEESQDIFATHKQPDSNSRREPWNREYNCVSYEPVDEPVRCSASGSASLGLPSLRSERCAIFAELGTLSFPIPLLDKTYGIEFVFGRLFKVFRRLSSTPSLPLLKEYMQGTAAL
ncbi:unnamed protein product [Heligmosomoides polygyrus]|uniref:Uncharacterized protein n=1 Tax=Heligmosomoides polygyrus TaxID=6339 RepID=A0A3P7WKD1_HELPZ|nr:unnamed protein product [Heligmosomoides polygyrus]